MQRKRITDKVQTSSEQTHGREQDHSFDFGMMRVNYLIWNKAVYWCLTSLLSEVVTQIPIPVILKLIIGVTYIVIIPTLSWL